MTWAYIMELCITMDVLAPDGGAISEASGKYLCHAMLRTSMHAVMRTQRSRMYEHACVLSGIAC